jgi:DNA-binding NtrC family response regulator
MDPRARVLFVDDEAGVREVFEAIFADDFEVVVVSSGAAALDALAHGQFDVLVTDMRMEPMKGSQLLARAYAEHPDTQRILLTGYSDHDDLASAVNVGHVFAYVQKPWEAENLRLTIKRAAQIRALELEDRRLLAELKAANARLKGGRAPEPPRSSPKVRSDGAIPARSIALNLPEGGTTFDDLEREILVQVLARAEGNQSRAARSLGLSESTLRSRLKRLGLKG